MYNKELVFDDLDSFWNFSIQESHAYTKTSREIDYDNWTGTKTWEEAKDLANKGWKEGLKEVEKYSAEITPFITSKVLRPIQSYSVSGYCLDVGSFLASQPEHFISREYEQRNYPGRIFRLVVSVSFSSSISKETIIQRGSMVCALVDAIEYAGHRAEVICNDASSKYNSDSHRKGENKEDGWFETSITIKKANQPLEMTDLAFSLAHPAMLRRILFSVAEIEGWSDFSGNYGYPAEATDKGDIYIREIYSGTISNEKAINWVLDELRKLGIDLQTN